MRITGDGITFALASSAAATSAAFAGYMWIVDPAGVFEGRVILDRLPAVAQAADGFTGTRPIDPTISESSADPAPEILADQITTASTVAAQDGPPDAPVAGPDNRTQSLLGQLKGFRLMGVFGDTALVSPSRPASDQMWLVKAGMTLPGGGRVISIVKGRTNDSVFTTEGVIIAPSQAK